LLFPAAALGSLTGIKFVDHQSRSIRSGKSSKKMTMLLNPADLIFLEGP
jgi:hypothetical protein